MWKWVITFLGSNLFFIKKVACDVKIRYACVIKGGEIVNIDFIKFILMIIATVVSLYKYLEKEFRRKADKVEIENILKELDKKVDKILYDREPDFIRKNIQQNTTTLVEKLEEVKEDMKIIKEYILK